METFEQFKSVPNTEKINSGIPLDEQETTISFSRNGDLVDVWTSDTMMMTKLDKLCEEAPENYKCIEVSKLMFNKGLANKRYKIGKKSCVSFRSGKTSRVYTDEERAAMSERAKRAGLGTLIR